MTASRQYTDFTLFRRLILQARPYWPHIVGIFFLGLLKSLVVLLNPVPLKIAIDSVLGDHPLPRILDAAVPAVLHDSKNALLVLAAGLAVLIALLLKFQSIATSIVSTYAGEKLVLDFQSRLFRHAQRLSLSYHDNRGTADAAYRIKHDAPAIKYITVDGVTPLITSGVTLITMAYVSISLDWQLAVIALAVSPVFAVLARHYRRHMRSGSHAMKEIESASLSVIQEVLTSVRVVKAFGQEDREQERLVRRSTEGLRARLRLNITGGAFSLSITFATALCTAAVLYVGVRHVQSGELLLGNLLLMMTYIAQLYSPLTTITSKSTSLQTHLASAERAFSLLDEAPDVAERPDARPLARATGAVTFQDVTFAYGNDPPVLHDISFHVPAGTRVGVIGTTGAGKSTLVSLLTRFYDPTSGTILLDAADVRDFRIADLRNQFAIVLQETVLFSTTIAENIAYARPDAEMPMIIEAARAANAHDFISNLPEGYKTRVGERGYRLSGGERQRIALARAFLKDAPILILDEPTSSVDVRTEASIMEAMERLMRGHTSFMIAHRLSTLKHCDLVLEIEHGRLVATSGSRLEQLVV